MKRIVMIVPDQVTKFIATRHNNYSNHLDVNEDLVIQMFSRNSDYYVILSRRKYQELYLKNQATKPPATYPFSAILQQGHTTIARSGTG